jgi:fatty acid desaturase
MMIRACERTRPNSQLRLRHPIAAKLNLFLVCIVLGGTCFQLFGMPFAFRYFGMRAAWCLLPITLLQPLHWGLIHESIHTQLLPDRRHNEFCGRLLAVTLGIPFDATRFGHMVHHRYSRHGRDRPDVYDGRIPYAIAWLAYRARLFGGVYVGLIFAPLIACIPLSSGVRIMKAIIPNAERGDADVQPLFISLVSNESKRNSTRRDFLMTLLLYGVSAWIFGAWWPMLLASMYGRGLWHSLADNIAHHGVAADEHDRARNYALPHICGPFVMNHHLHLTHHLYPRVPWTSLVDLQVPERALPKGNYFQAAFRQIHRTYPRPIAARIGRWPR